MEFKSRELGETGVNGISENPPSFPETSFVLPVHNRNCVIFLEQIINIEKHSEHKTGANCL